MNLIELTMYNVLYALSHGKEGGNKRNILALGSPPYPNFPPQNLLYDLLLSSSSSTLYPKWIGDINPKQRSTNGKVLMALLTSHHTTIGKVTIKPSQQNN